MANSKNKQLTDLANVVFERLGCHVRPGQRLCIALSGGVDSVALLHAVVHGARRLNIPLPTALHVHHGLSPHADKWTAFCRTICERLDVELEVRYVEVRPEGDGVEGAARKVRHAQFGAVNADWVILGHHLDDQAETVLLNLLRGAGVHGASGMAERRGRLLRPLLNISRDEISAYAVRHGLEWIEDDSNADTRYNRNFLRHTIFPALEERFSQSRSILARAARSFEAAAQLLDEVAAEDLKNARRLNIAQLTSLSQTRALNLLAYYLRQRGVRISSSASLSELLKQLLKAGCDSEIRFTMGQWEVRRFHNEVWVEKPQLAVSTVVWNGHQPVPWGGYRIQTHATVGEGATASLLAEEALHFSARRGGERLQLRHNGPRRPLKDLLRESGIPPWRRKTLPLLFLREELVWVGGIGIAAKYRCEPGAAGFSIEFDGVTW